MQFLKALDASLLYAINKNLSAPFLDNVMPRVSAIGQGEIIFTIAACFLFFKGRGKMLGILLLAGLSLTYYSVAFLKNIVSRPRPFVSLSGIHLIGHADGYSFPSGHSTVVFMAAYLIAANFRKYPALAVVLYAVAALVAFSRTYLGVHYPSDTIAGAILGCAIGYALQAFGEVFGRGSDKKR